jgi:hypothetical protein
MFDSTLVLKSNNRYLDVDKKNEAIFSSELLIY